MNHPFHILPYTNEFLIAADWFEEHDQHFHAHAVRQKLFTLKDKIKHHYDQAKEKIPTIGSASGKTWGYSAPRAKFSYASGYKEGHSFGAGQRSGNGDGTGDTKHNSISPATQIEYPE